MLTSKDHQESVLFPKWKDFNKKIRTEINRLFINDFDPEVAQKINNCIANLDVDTEYTIRDMFSEIGFPRGIEWTSWNDVFVYLIYLWDMWPINTFVIDKDFLRQQNCLIGLSPDTIVLLHNFWIDVYVLCYWMLVWLIWNDWVQSYMTDGGQILTYLLKKMENQDLDDEYKDLLSKVQDIDKYTYLKKYISDIEI